MNDVLDLESLLTEAMRARTANVQGDAASLSHLRNQLHPRPSRSGWIIVAAAVACAAAIVAAFVVSGRFVGKQGGTTAAYPASQYMLAYRGSADRGSGVLSIVRIDDLQPVRSLHVRLEHPLLSADGRYVYGVGAAGKTPGIVAFDLQDGQTRLIAPAKQGDVTGFTLSEDGRVIAYALLHTDVTPNRTSIVTSTIHGDRKRVIDLKAGTQVLPMSLSPDGSSLAFTQTHTFNSIFIMRLTASHPLDALSVFQPASSCGYDYPHWTSSALYVLSSCGDSKYRVQASTVATLDPTSGAIRTVAGLPRHDVMGMQATATPAGTAVFVEEAIGVDQSSQVEITRVYRIADGKAIPVPGLQLAAHF